MTYDKGMFKILLIMSGGLTLHILVQHSADEILSDIHIEGKEDVDRKNERGSSKGKGDTVDKTIR